MSPFYEAVRFGGMVIAHAAWIASDLEEGSLVCPFAIIEKAGEREVIAFEADTQAESVERGKATLEALKDNVDLWGFAREGLLSYVGSNQPKVDVLSVSAWRTGLDEPIILHQRFIPKAEGTFKLIGAIEVSIHGLTPPEPTQTTLRNIALEGVKWHPRGELWDSWMIA